MLGGEPMGPAGGGAERFACTGIRGLQLLVVDNVETNAVEQAEPAAVGRVNSMPPGSHATCRQSMR